MINPWRISKLTRLSRQVSVHEDAGSDKIGTFRYPLDTVELKEMSVGSTDSGDAKGNKQYSQRPCASSKTSFLVADDGRSIRAVGSAIPKL